MTGSRSTFASVDTLRVGPKAVSQRPYRVRFEPTRIDQGDRTSSVLDLQRQAGNRAVTALLAPIPVQRHEGPTLPEEVEDAEPVQAGAGTTTTGTSTTGTGTTGTGTTGTGTTGTGITGTGTGTTGTGSLTGAARTKAIEDTLRASDTGSWALGVIDKYQIPMDYEYGGQGSFHQDGRIFINKTLGVGAAALTTMHEAQHADTFKSGKQADRSKLSRDEYVRLSIADEAEATVRQIEGLSVTERLGSDMTGNPVTDDLKARYLKAFYKKRDELRKANPGMSTAEINKICRTSARDGEVTNWFSDGTFVTSTNKNNYYDFYGQQWDDVHKAPGH